jgi:MFS family permease
VHGLLAATGLSVAGNAMVAVLVPWLVLQRTGSPAQAGLVGSVALAAAVPALLLGGPLIDRWGRRRVSAGADLLSAAAVAALPLLDHVVGLSLLSTLALVAVGALFDGPGGAAREASRPDVAAAAGAAVETVNARGEAAEGAGGIAGPALAGAGIGLVGALGSLWLAAALFVIAAAATWRSLPRDAAPAVPREPYLRAAGSGLRLVGRDRTLRAIAVLGMVAMLFVAPVPLVLAAHLEPQGQAGALGLVAAALALGGAVGALTYERVGTRGSRPAVLAGGLAAGAAGFAAMATLPGTVALAVLAAGTGLAVGPVNPVLAVLLQDRTPGGLRGRVVATTWSLSLIASPLGVLGAGLILEAAGPRAALLVIAAGCLLTSAYALAAPGLRRTPRPDLPDAPDAPDREGTRP